MPEIGVVFGHAKKLEAIEIARHQDSGIMDIQLKLTRVVFERRHVAKALGCIMGRCTETDVRQRAPREHGKPIRIVGKLSYAERVVFRGNLPGLDEGMSPFVSTPRHAFTVKRKDRVPSRR